MRLLVKPAKLLKLKDCGLYECYLALSWSVIYFECIAFGVTNIAQTSLNMPGFSLTILRLPSAQEPNAPNSSLLLSLLDDNPNVPGWKWSYKGIPPHLSTQFISATNKTSSPTHFVHLQAADPLRFVSKIQRACNALIAAEPEITRMDTVSGDGDCGLTL